MNMSDSRNVEIKAKIIDIDYVTDLAKDLTQSNGVIINQRDTFFKSEQGRLKMRLFEDKLTDPVGEIIYYNRPNKSGPKLSEYKKIDLDGKQFQEMHDLLTMALGVEDVVIKERTLFLFKNTRIHIDNVKNLGQFIELETVLAPEHTIEDGEKEIKEIMSKLNIHENDLLTNSYSDMQRHK